MQRFHFILRQSLVALLALQFLNLSVNNAAAYEYSYGSNGNDLQTGSDPTETAVELILEANYGQMDIFTYKTNPESNKSTAKAICFHIDLINHEPAGQHVLPSPLPACYPGRDEKVMTIPRAVSLPPPKYLFFA